MSNIPFRENYQVYARIEKVLGNMRFTLKCSDKVTRIGVLRGRMYRRNWIKINDIVLADLREYQDSKVDITHQYSQHDVKYLQKLGEIDRKFVDGESDVEDEFEYQDCWDTQEDVDQEQGLDPEDIDINIDEI